MNEKPIVLISSSLQRHSNTLQCKEMEGHYAHLSQSKKDIGLRLTGSKFA